MSSTSVVSSLPPHSYEMIVKTTEFLAPDDMQLLLINCDTSRAGSRELHSQMRSRDGGEKPRKLTLAQDTRVPICTVRVTISLVR